MGKQGPSVPPRRRGHGASGPENLFKPRNALRSLPENHPDAQGGEESGNFKNFPGPAEYVWHPFPVERGRHPPAVPRHADGGPDQNERRSGPPPDYPEPER